MVTAHADIPGAVGDHLPECDYEQTKDVCYCDMLRACEQRVRDEIAADGPWFRSVVHQCCEDKQTSYAAGLDAAREAVMGVSVYRWAYSEPKDPYTECITVDSAVAAINALKEKP